MSLNGRAFFKDAAALFMTETLERSAVMNIRQMHIAAERDAAELKARIETAARELAGAMQELHGGDWSISINHESCVVMIAERIPHDM